MSYLGLGVLGIIMLAACVDGKNVLRRLRRSPALVLALLGMLVFALSSDVYLGTTKIYHYPSILSDPLFASPLVQFRASARFFMPVGYALLFWGLAVILRRRWAIPVLAGLLLIQWIDLPRPLTPRPTAYAQAFNPDFPAWDRLFKDKRALYLYPTNYCGGDEDMIGFPAVLIAAKNGVRINTVSVCRLAENCEEKVAQGFADWSAGTVHLFTRPADYPQVLQDNNNWCAERADLLLCIPYANDDDRAFLATIDDLALPGVAKFYFP